MTAGRGLYSIRRNSLNKRRWSRLHNASYHPELPDVIKRIENDINSEDSHALLREWSEIFGHSIEVHGKIVLEIGHGGGWYLAQCIRAGCQFALGIEISPEINNKAREALVNFGYSNFLLLEVADQFLADINYEVDVIYCNTVFQHLAPDITESYLKSASEVMNASSDFYFQILENDRKTQRLGSPSDVLSISYSRSELEALVKDANLQIIRRVEKRYQPVGSYWAYYHVRLPT